MANTTQLEYKLMRAAELLAQSPLRDSIKETIASKIGELSEAQLDSLIASLEYEQRELAHAGNEFMKFDKQQDEDWKKLEEEQRAKADQMVNELLKDLPE